MAKCRVSLAESAPVSRRLATSRAGKGFLREYSLDCGDESPLFSGATSRADSGDKSPVGESGDESPHSKSLSSAASTHALASAS